MTFSSAARLRSLQYRAAMLLAFAFVLLVNVGARPAVSADDASGATHLLRYIFNTGDVVRSVVQDESKVDIAQQGSETQVSYQTTSWKRYTVKSVDADGNATLELKIDRVKMKAGGDGKTIEFDSQNVGAAPAEFSHIRETVGPPIAEIVVTPYGEVMKVTRLLNADKKNKDVDDRNISILSLLPVESVTVGSQWKERYEVDILVPPALTKTIKMQKVFTLKSVDADTATIEMQTMVITPITDPKESVQLIQRTPSGVIQLDLKLGRVQSRSNDLHNTVVDFAGEGSRLKVDRLCNERLLSEGEDASTDIASTPTTESSAKSPR